MYTGLGNNKDSSSNTTANLRKAIVDSYSSCHWRLHKEEFYSVVMMLEASPKFEGGRAMALLTFLTERHSK